MSTLPGQASKGEKSKPKFQSLDINNLYKNSRGENSEKTQQKNSFTNVKYGMQSLGKVPSARRAPANLPSLKSEHSGTDAAVALIPPGGTGWGKQETSSTTSTTTSTTVTTASTQSSTTTTATQPPQLSSHQANIALPVNVTIPPQQKQQQQPQQQQQTQPTVPNVGTTDKLWSTVTIGQDSIHHPPPYQSAQFQHEFPSLSAAGQGDAGGIGNGGNTVRTNTDAQYPTGLSLRPQTEGSWTQGGAAKQAGGGGGGGQDSRPGSAPLGAPPQLTAQVGQQQQQQQQQPPQLPPQFLGVIPPFMYKGNFGGNQQQQQQQQQANGRNVGRLGADRPPRLIPDANEITPIVKMEELNRMDEIGSDMGWAGQDDIDYSQKLSFSDDESDVKKPIKKEVNKQQEHYNETTNRSSSNNWQKQQQQQHQQQQQQTHNDDFIRCKKDIDQAVQRAIIRKEEEEKRFSEGTKAGANKMLQDLEQRITKRNGENLKQKITDIPLPDFQKEKERNEQQQQQQQHQQQQQNSNEEKSMNRENNFRQLTQIEGKNLTTSATNQANRKQYTKNERDTNGPSFSRQFQNDLPPRFLKARNNSNSNLQQSQPQQQQQQQQSQQSQQFYNNSENRWQSNQKSRNIRQDSPDNRDGDYKRQSSDDSFHRSSDKRHDSQSDTSSSSNWHEQRRSCDERPARPDSRDSRSTRHSRDSEPRDWSESYESGFDEKKHLRPVPGPITKDRIEQDDLRNEKRNLTQLKRGEKKLDVKKDDKLLDDNEKIITDDLNSNLTSSWADSIPSALDQTETIQQTQEKSIKLDNKNDIKLKNDDYNKDRRNRNYQTNKSWGMNEYRSTSWTKRQTNRGHKMGSSNRSANNEYHNNDSDGSFDECSPKTLKKFDKDEKNLKEKQKMDKYVPKGEPTRHGRGGSSSSFRGSRVVGISKRIDAYGPPQTKQPFSNLHADEKKTDENCTDLSSSDDKAKQNQQALSAGLTARDDKTKLRNNNSKIEHNKPHGKSKSKINDDNCDTNSENSDEKDGKLNRKMQFNVKNTIRNQGPPPPPQRRQPPPTSAPRLGVQRQNSMKKDDLDVKDDERDEKSSFNGDTEGFQEVKSKKNVKKLDDNNKPSSIVNKDVKKDIKTDTRKKPSSGQMTQQQIQNIPSLMSMPVQPPIMKNPYDRPRQMKLAPRFAKAKLQKAAQMQQHQQVNTSSTGLCDVSDINKSLYGIKENNNTNQVNNSGGQVSCSAWDKPLSTQIHQIEHDGGNTNMLTVGLDSVKTIEQQNQTNVSPNHDKIIVKQQLQDKNLLDGTTPPVNTIIFENTNFKSTPVPRNPNTNNKSQRKLDESPTIDAISSGFNKPLLSDATKPDTTMQLQLSFKEDNADMKLDFFGSDLSHLTDEKTTTSSSTTAKNLCMSKTMHSITSSGSVNSNTICTADSLNIKIASVKKVWETPSEHGQVDDGNTSFTNSFVTDPNTLDPNNVFSKGTDTPDDNHEGYSPSPNQTASTTTNVCKVKPTQQVSGSSGQTVLSSTSHQQHSGIVPPSLMGNPLSPPPMQQVIGAGVGIGQPPQQYTTNHLSYQAGLGGSTQYGMSTIPSPPTVPTVLYNSTQPLQAAQTGLYGAFQIDQSGVLGSQGRSQYSQYPNHYGLGQTASSPYSTQSVYLPATPAHPPPPPPTAPELYTNSYRLSATAPFGQNQQLNNPTTVLISSTSNSLMSASVKPSSQQISAIGTKSGGVGQAYQQQSQQGQVYIPYDPSIQANYLSGGGVMQRAPTGPVQNNVVPALQSSSYYSQSTGGQTGYFQQPGNSTIQSAQLQQHQTGFGLQTNVFGQHNQSHTNAGVQNYSSHFLSAPAMQMAAISAQQYRNTLPQYMKTVGNQPNLGGDQNRPQQLKSPSSQEVLSSVFNSGSQISSPKSKQNAKHPPPQSSPTAQQKYLYQGITHQTGNFIKFDQGQRYPTPIQRPVNNFQQNLNIQQNNANNQKHRSNNSSNKAPNRQYYSQRNTNSTNNPSSGQKTTPLGNSGSAGGGGAGGGGGGGGSATAPPAAEIVKDSIKEETTTLKD